MVCACNCLAFQADWPEPSFQADGCLSIRPRCTRWGSITSCCDLGNDLNAVDKNGETAMHGAAYKHVPTVVRYLAEKGARIDVWNRPNSKGWTPLKITEGVQRGMNIVSSPVTAAAIREVLASKSATLQQLSDRAIVCLL